LNLLEAAFHSASIGTALVGLDGTWLRVNQAICRIVGYSEEELLKLTFQDITHPDDLAGDVALVEQLLRGEASHYELEKRYLHKDGRIVWIHLSATLTRTPAGEPWVFLSQIQDITARKRAEKAREALFRLPVALHFVSGFDGYFKELSPSWAELLGFPIDHLLSVPYLALVHPEDRQKTFEEAALTVAGRSTFLFENRYLHADGSSRWLLWTSRSVAEDELVYGVALDYTARKAAELALQQTLAEKERLLEELRAAQQESLALREGLLTVCAWTKRIKHDGRWMSMDEFLSSYLHLHLTHGISDEGMKTALEDVAQHAQVVPPPPQVTPGPTGA
jgi:PAS domain S-box-containing protein